MHARDRASQTHGRRRPCSCKAPRVRPSAPRALRATVCRRLPCATPSPARADVINAQSPRNRRVITARSPRDHHVITARSTRDHGVITAPSPARAAPLVPRHVSPRRASSAASQRAPPSRRRQSRRLRIRSRRDLGAISARSIGKMISARSRRDLGAISAPSDRASTASREAWSTLGSSLAG